MKCLVVTPVGPGHETIVEACKISVRHAVATSPGPFGEILHYLIDDTKGEIGRSAARNSGIAKAREVGAQWIFFLDADDLMAQSAFAAVQPYVGEYDAVWGQICELLPGADHLHIRGQLESIADFDELLAYDPYLTLQMGHFVRTELAEAVRFDETMDCGEDVAFYCGEWRRGRCVKIPEVLFVNRRGSHSTGPRATDGGGWRVAAEAVLADHRRRRPNASAPFPLGRNNVIVTAHPDDEVLWCGGLPIRFRDADWTIICCSIPRQDPVRAHHFFDACRELGATGRILPFTESEPGEPLRGLDLLDLSGFDCIVTHNRHGEYGHGHHTQVHEHVVRNWGGKTIVTFGYRKGARGIFRLDLLPAEVEAKAKALRAYRHHHPYEGRDIPKWKALEHRYYEVEGLDPAVETYDWKPGAPALPAAHRAEGDYQQYSLDAEGRLAHIGERMRLKLDAIPLPDLTGKDVLDIGCDFAFWTFLAAQKGARRVLGLDRNRQVRGKGFVDLVSMNGATAAQFPKLSGCTFRHAEVGRQWPRCGRFDVVFLFSLYHHIYESCGGDHLPIWYWLWTQIRPDGVLLWENPVSVRDPVVQRNVSPEHHARYTAEEILSAAGRYFVARLIGPALHEPDRVVYAFTPRPQTAVPIPIQTRDGAGGASRAFLHADGRRQREIASALGIQPFPGSLNAVCPAGMFDWDADYLRVRMGDVADRARGIDSAWEPRWARFYPVSVEGADAFVFRFEGDRYSDDFLELVAAERLRDRVLAEGTIVRERPAA